MTTELDLILDSDSESDDDDDSDSVDSDDSTDDYGNSIVFDTASNETGTRIQRSFSERPPLPNARASPRGLDKVPLLEDLASLDRGGGSGSPALSPARLPPRQPTSAPPTPAESPPRGLRPPRASAAQLPVTPTRSTASPREIVLTTNLKTPEVTPRQKAPNPAPEKEKEKEKETASTTPRATPTTTPRKNVAPPSEAPSASSTQPTLTRVPSVRKGKKEKEREVVPARTATPSSLHAIESVSPQRKERIERYEGELRALDAELAARKRGGSERRHDVRMSSYFRLRAQEQRHHNHHHLSPRSDDITESSEPHPYFVGGVDPTVIHGTHPRHSARARETILSKVASTRFGISGTVDSTALSPNAWTPGQTTRAHSVPNKHRSRDRDWESDEGEKSQLSKRDIAALKQVAEWIRHEPEVEEVASPPPPPPPTTTKRKKKRTSPTELSPRNLKAEALSGYKPPRKGALAPFSNWGDRMYIEGMVDRDAKHTWGEEERLKREIRARQEEGITFAPQISERARQAPTRMFQMKTEKKRASSATTKKPRKKKPTKPIASPIQQQPPLFPQNNFPPWHNQIPQMHPSMWAQPPYLPYGVPPMYVPGYPPSMMPQVAQSASLGSTEASVQKSRDEGTEERFSESAATEEDEESSPVPNVYEWVREHLPEEEVKVTTTTTTTTGTPRHTESRAGRKNQNQNQNPSASSKTATSTTTSRYPTPHREKEKRRYREVTSYLHDDGMAALARKRRKEKDQVRQAHSDSRIAAHLKEIRDQRDDDMERRKRDRALAIRTKLNEVFDALDAKKTGVTSLSNIESWLEDMEESLGGSTSAPQEVEDMVDFVRVCLIPALRACDTTSFTLERVVSAFEEFAKRGAFHAYLSARKRDPSPQYNHTPAINDYSRKIAEEKGHTRPVHERLAEESRARQQRQKEAQLQGRIESLARDLNVCTFEPSINPTKAVPGDAESDATLPSPPTPDTPTRSYRRHARARDYMYVQKLTFFLLFFLSTKECYSELKSDLCWFINTKLKWCWQKKGEIQKQFREPIFLLPYFH